MQLAHGLSHLLQQSQHVLGLGVGLRKHRNTGLLQDLSARQVSRFLRKVRIANP